MALVLVTRRLPEGALESLEAHEIIGPDVDDRPMGSALLRSRASEVDAILSLLTDRIDASVLGAGQGRLRVVANVAAGYENIDVAAARRLGISVCNTPGVLDESTADLAFLLILAAARRSSEAEAALRLGNWRGWEVDGFLGRDLHGATLGLVGYGRIGRAVAKRAGGFGMRVLHHARHPTGDSGYVAVLDELLPRVDILSLHVPGGAETKNLIDARRLGLMRDSAVLINTARGSVLDELALADALDSGRLFGAGLDVYESEPKIRPRLLQARNVVLLPHIGSATFATRLRMARLAAEGVRAVLAGETPENLLEG